jgi:hypothetical protein
MLDDGAGDGQAQAEACAVLGPGGAAPVEALEHPGDLLGRDARTLV